MLDVDKETKCMSMEDAKAKNGKAALFRHAEAI
jgi:hypothetical protein